MSDEEPVGQEQPPRRPFLVVKGDATPEEVAALVAVLGGIAGSARPASSEGPPRSEWAAHHRKLRWSPPAGPEGWRSSGLPR